MKRQETFKGLEYWVSEASSAQHARAYLVTYDKVRAEYLEACKQSCIPPVKLQFCGSARALYRSLDHARDYLILYCTRAMESSTYPLAALKNSAKLMLCQRHPLRNTMLREFNLARAHFNSIQGGFLGARNKCIAPLITGICHGIFGA